MDAQLAGAGAKEISFDSDDVADIEELEELEIAQAPVLFGRGRRLFDDVPESVPGFRIDKVVASPNATLLRYVRE